MTDFDAFSETLCFHCGGNRWWLDRGKNPGWRCERCEPCINPVAERRTTSHPALRAGMVGDGFDWPSHKALWEALAGMGEEYVASHGPAAEGSPGAAAGSPAFDPAEFFRSAGSTW